jgi:dihydrofolate reductase
MNNTPKVVVSSTLDKADWQNSTLIRDNVASEVAKLKQQSGKSINTTGSATLVRWLLRNGLLDELDLLVFPVVLGEGKRLFEGVGDQVALKLVESKAFPSGVLHVTYEPA